MLTRYRSRVLGGAAFVALMTTASLASAQTAGPAPSNPPDATSASPSELKEVVVTAQRRSENLQKVPISVSSFSGESIATHQITNTLDLLKEVPNLFATHNVGLGSANEYYLRGLGSSQSFPTYDTQVGVYIDDVYIARQNANNFALFGVDQVQVLNGPQGTLFGRNSTGGAIVVSLSKPRSEFGGDGQISYGSFNGFTARLSVDIPISDQLLTKTSVFGVSDDGYVKDVTTGQKLDYTHNWGAREAITLKPRNLSNVQWNVAVDYEHNDSANIYNEPVGSGGVDGDGRIAFTGLTTTPGQLAPYFHNAMGKLGLGALVETGGLTSNLRIDAGSGVLNLITGYRNVLQNQVGDFPKNVPGPGDVYDVYLSGGLTTANVLRSEEYSQEVKWTSQIGPKFNYTAGVYFMYQKDSGVYGELFNLAAFSGSKTTFNIPFEAANEGLKDTVRSTAGYAQGDYHFTDKLTLTVGARYSDETKFVSVLPNFAGGYTTEEILEAGHKTHLHADEVTPHFALQYQVDPQLMLFGTITKGFQGGGWNSLASKAADFENFGPETIWSYETGYRWETSDHKFRWNTTFFYENVDNYQLEYDNPATGTFDTTNAASMEGFGAESSIDWRPIDNLTLGLRMGAIRAFYFNQAAIIKAQQTQCVTLKVNCDNGIVRPNGDLADPAFTPTFQSTLTAAYDIQLQPMVITPNISLQYTGHETVDLAETPGSGEDVPRLLVDGSVIFAPRGQPFTVTAECSNCTNVNYKTTLLLNTNFWNPPGRWTVMVHYKF